MTKTQVLKEYFGYDSFREGQEGIIDALLSGRDVLAVMPTGAGKSICYQVPALVREEITLVISPLISLMHDQVKALNAAGVHAAYINSSLTEGQITKALQLAARGQYKLIYVAPERLLTPMFLDFAQGADISLVAVDEAHCISQWGQDFRPSYQRIVQFLRMLPSRPAVGAFTATATPEVKEDIWASLGLSNPLVYVSGFDRPNLYFEVDRASGKEKDAFILSYVKEHSSESGIIYCATRKSVDEIYQKLFKEGIAVARYHAGMGSEERNRNQQSFVEDVCPVMVATNAFGMGIDKSNVRYILHLNMPSCMENYYQEAGRAGRDGEAASCILLYSPQDVMIQRYLLDRKDFSQVEPEDALLIQERDRKRLRNMEGYCTGGRCLRNTILSYFGEKTGEDCGNCSCCQREGEEKDLTEEAGWVCRCVQEYGGRYGRSIILGTLRGEKTARLREVGAANLSSFGKLSEISRTVLSSLTEKLLREGFLEERGDRYPVLGCGEKAGALLAGEETVSLRVVEEAERPGKKAGRSPSLTSTGFALFERLREVRSRVARENHVPPYIVFSDKTLIDMCVKKPGSREELLTVFGVARRKADSYGDAFLGEIQAFLKEKPDQALSEGGEEENSLGKELSFGEELSFGGEEGDAGAAGKKRGARKSRKLPFLLPEGALERIPFAPFLDATALRDLFNDCLSEEDGRKKVTAVQLYAFFCTRGYLTLDREMDSYYPYRLSPEGEEAGIRVEKRTTQKGKEYETFLFPEGLQREAAEFFSSEEAVLSLEQKEQE